MLSVASSQASPDLNRSFGFMSQPKIQSYDSGLGRPGDEAKFSVAGLVSKESCGLKTLWNVLSGYEYMCTQSQPIGMETCVVHHWSSIAFVWPRLLPVNYSLSSPRVLSFGSSPLT